MYRTAIPRLSKVVVRVAETVRGLAVALRKITEVVVNFDATITEDKHQEE